MEQLLTFLYVCVGVCVGVCVVSLFIYASHSFVYLQLQFKTS